MWTLVPSQGAPGKHDGRGNMKLQRKIVGITGALLMGIVGAVALATPASAGTYRHQLQNASGLCLEAPGNGRNVQLILNTCTGAANQQFDFIDAGYNWAYFLQPASSGLCLIPGVSNLYDSTVVLWDCNWSRAQVWFLDFGSAPGTRALRNSYSGYCLGVRYAYAGAMVRQNECSANWRLWYVV
jgi:hypothetical protein